MSGAEPALSPDTAPLTQTDLAQTLGEVYNTQIKKEEIFVNENWKKELKPVRAWAIALSCCLFALGIVMVIRPAVSAVVVCCLMGALCLAMGVSELVRYFRLGFAGVFFRFDLTLGICSILIGVLLFVHPQGAVAFLPIAIGIYMIMGSVFCVQLAVELRRFNNSGWWMALVWGVLGAVFAMLLLIDPFAGASTLMVITGVALMVSGVQSLYLVLSVSRELRDGKNEHVIDAHWRPVD